VVCEAGKFLSPSQMVTVALFCTEDRGSTFFQSVALSVKVRGVSVLLYGGRVVLDQIRGVCS